MERPLLEKAWNKHQHSLAVVFPNLYYGGVYSLGPLLIYNLVNSKPNWVCKRQFLDKNNLKEFNFIGFSFQYELDYKNFSKMLQENNISLSKDRDQIIFAGGPCITLNPRTMEQYIDFMLLGDVEQTLQDVLAVYEQHPEKQEFLQQISNMPGVYVPGVTKAPSVAQVNLDDYPYPLYQPLPGTLTKDFVFGNAFLLEIERGCLYNCNFCAIPKYFPNVKFRSLEKLKGIIDEGVRINGRKKIVIYAPSLSHPKRKEILQYLLDKDLSFSIPSLRVEYLDKELLELIRQGGTKSLTIAPETGQSLRPSVGKDLKDEEFLKGINLAEEIGFENIKLYFMVGLPNQTKKDLDEIIAFVQQAKAIFSGRVYVSLNPFVPKPTTVFGGCTFDKKQVGEQIEYMRRNTNTRMKLGNIATSQLEWQYAHAKEIVL